MHSKAVAAHSELRDRSAQVLVTIVFEFIGMKNIEQRVITHILLNDTLRILAAECHFAIAQDWNPLEKVAARIQQGIGAVGRANVNLSPKVGHPLQAD